MIGADELEDTRPDLEALLSEVLTSVFAEEAYPTVDMPPAADRVCTRLSVADESDGTHLGVQLRVGPVLARLLAWRMFSAGNPTTEDLLDAVGELGNIAAGNVKALLFRSARLSLPASTLGGDPAAGLPDPPEAVSVCATVLGEVVELVLLPGAPAHGLTWPPTTDDEVLETRA